MAVCSLEMDVFQVDVSGVKSFFVMITKGSCQAFYTTACSRSEHNLERIAGV